MIDLKRNTRDQNIENENRIAFVALSTQHAEDASKFSDFRIVRDQKSVTTVDTLFSKAVNKRSKRDLDVEIFSIKKTREFDNAIKDFSFEESSFNYNITQYIRNCVALLFIIEAQKHKRKSSKF